MGLENIVQNIDKKIKTTVNVMKNDIANVKRYTRMYAPVAKPLIGGAAIGAGLYSLFYGASFLPMFVGLGVASGLFALLLYSLGTGIKYCYDTYNKYR